MFHEKIEAIIAVCSFLSAVIGGAITRLVQNTKEKAQFVTRRELDRKLSLFAKKEDLERVELDVQRGFDRIEKLFYEDRNYQHRRESALIERIDEIMTKK